MSLEKSEKKLDYLNVEAIVNSLDTNINDILEYTSDIGSTIRAGTNELYGISHTGTKAATPENRDAEGYTFFTRPQLNLSKGNLYSVRKFYSLLTTNSNSIPRYVRMMLDPRLKINDGLNCDLLNNNTAFIPVLTNNLKTMSGWPDIVLPTFTSKSGLMKEQQSIADGIVDIYETFDLDVTFKNTIEEPIIYMMQVWVYYMAYVYTGRMAPYMDMVAENEIDYNTRIYRLVTDSSYNYVKKIAATGASIPVNVPVGKVFDVTGSVYDQNNKDINIRFKCDGAMYNDDVLIKEFNESNFIYHPKLKEELIQSLDPKLSIYNYQPIPNGRYELIPPHLVTPFNHRGIPIINPNDSSLGWWIDTEDPVDGALYKYIIEQEKNKNKKVDRNDFRKTKTRTV